MLFQLPEAERLFFYLSLVAILFALLFAWYGLLTGNDRHKAVVVAMLSGIIACAVSIGLRWAHSGSGPFMSLYEVLISNLFSLGVIFVLAYIVVPLSRPSAPIVLPVLCVIGVWAGTSSMAPVELPATYDTALLWIHVGVGKVFLGLCMIAFGLAGLLLMKHITAANMFNTIPATERLDDLAWRFMAVAFVFHSLMLIAGAAWAQDAWGRFWAWDSLETWAFITWLFIGLGLHMRLTWKLPEWTGWLMIVGAFTLAILTFFGVPFTSLGPHKGII